MFRQSLARQRKNIGVLSGVLPTARYKSCSNYRPVLPMADVQTAVTLPTGYSLPTIGFGVYQIPPSACSDAVESAIKVGYRHVDCAQHYENEAEVGQGLRNSGVPREQVFITSKVYNSPPYEETLRLVEESVEKLGSGLYDRDRNIDARIPGYYDLFLVHSPHGGREGRLAKYRALLETKKRGWVRTVGVSNYSEKHIKEILEEGLEKPAVNQVELHPWCQQRPIVSYCKSEGIVVQAYTPLLRGSEAGKGKGIKSPAVLKIAAKHGKSPAQVLIRWSLQTGLVPLPKATSPHRMQENFEVFDFALDEEDMVALDALDQGARGAVCWNPVDEP